MELFVEKPEANDDDVVFNNSLALALNSNSSECVRAILQAATSSKISWGSYHCYNSVMPGLVGRYPYLSYQFLAGLKNEMVGDLEVPFQVMDGLRGGLIRTAPIFTNVNRLWQSHINSMEAKTRAVEVGVGKRGRKR